MSQIKRLFIVLFLIVAAVAIVSCRRDEPAEPTPTTVPAPTAPAATPEATDTPDTGGVAIESGRYHLAAPGRLQQPAAGR